MAAPTMINSTPEVMVYGPGPEIKTGTYGRVCAPRMLVHYSMWKIIVATTQDGVNQAIQNFVQFIHLGLGPS